MNKSTGTGRFVFFLLAALLTITACTTTAPPEPLPAQPGQYGAVDFYNWVRTATPDELQQELDLLNQSERHINISATASDNRALADLWRQVLELRLQVFLLHEQIEALTDIERKIDIRDQQEQ